MGVAQDQSVQSELDERYMRRALELAIEARSLGEVPIGAVIVQNDEIIGEGFNQPIRSNDPSAHAEIVALRTAGEYLKNYRIVDSTIYVTIEPCMMCVGAMVHSRVARLVYGADEPKAGAVRTRGLLGADWQNHQIEIESGVLASECSTLMSDFFRLRRERVDSH